jgi:hypothetical protein
MNLQESIRRILREETNFMLAIRRRVPHEDLEREFEESLDMASNMFFNLIKNGGDAMSLKRFVEVTISILIDGIHYELYSTIPGDIQWYVDAKKSLEEYYKDRIKVRYERLISELYTNLQESIRKVLREETEYITKKILNFLKRRFEVKKIPVRDEKTSRIVKTLFFEKNGKTWAIEKGINERHQIAIIFDVLITFEVIDPFNIYKKDFDHNEQKIIDAIKIFLNKVM